MPASGRKNLIRIETYRQIQPKEGTKIPLLMSLNATCPHVKGEKTFSTLLNCNLSLTQYIIQQADNENKGFNANKALNCFHYKNLL